MAAKPKVSLFTRKMKARQEELHEYIKRMKAMNTSLVSDIGYLESALADIDHVLKEETKGNKP